MKTCVGHEIRENILQRSNDEQQCKWNILNLQIGFQVMEANPKKKLT